MDNRSFLAGVGVGAALAFMLDPDRGNRRRALVRDKMVRGARLTRDGLDATARDAANRARGLAASTRSRFAGEPVDDQRLLERVRARLGRATSHPHAIDVDVCDGEVTLRGPILAHEVPGLIAAAGSIQGVCCVHDELEPHESPQGIPSLQGDGRVYARP